MPDIIETLKISDIVTYNPFDQENNFRSKGLNEDIFFSTFFVELKCYEKYYRQIQDFIQSRDSKKFKIIFSYSGNGKSTFLHYAKRKLQAQNECFEIINIIDRPLVDYGDDSLIKKSVSFYIKESVNLNQTMQFIYEKRDLLRDAFIEETNDDWITLLDLADCFVNSNPNKAKVNDIINTFSLSTLLLLLFLIKFVQYQDDDTKSITFCFDNLDELGFEYLTESIWNQFCHVFYEKIKKLCENAEKCLDIEKVKVIIVFREATFAIKSSQHFDKFESKIDAQMRMMLGKDSEDIFSVRLQLAERSIDAPNKRDFIDFLNIVHNELITRKYLLPLFNFDHRGFHLVLCNIYSNYRNPSETVPYYLNTTITKYMEIRELSPAGARGILLNAIIRFLWIDGFLGRISEELMSEWRSQNKCNYARMMLTVLYGRSFPNGLSNNIETMLLAEPKPHLLKDVVLELLKLVPKVKIIQHLNNFFMINNGSKTHLITIYNLNMTRDSYKTIEQSVNEIEMNSIEKNDVEKTPIYMQKKIFLNASGTIYLRLILPHFEHYSTICCEKHRKPLFLATQLVEENKPTTKAKIFEFQKIIDSTLKVAGGCRERTNEHLGKIINTPHFPNLESYIDSNYVYKDSKSLFSSRVITTHIEYIDQFRYFLWFDDSFNNYFKEKLNKENIQLNSNVKIQLYLVACINKYLGILESGIETNSMKEKKNELSAIAQSLNENYFIKLNSMDGIEALKFWNKISVRSISPDS